MEIYCQSCPIPGIMSRLETARNAAESANANVLASDSPTQASPFRQEAITQLATLRQAIGELSSFVSSGKKCQSCQF
jgi:hypothetical protein